MSTAAATSSSAGYSSDRPATRPLTLGSRSALRQPAYADSGSSGTSPPSSRAGSVDAVMTRSMSGTTGTFSQVYADVVPRPEATAMARIMASGDRSLRTRPSTRWQMNGSIMAISRREARSDTACAQACRVAAVARSSGSMRSSILPPSNPIRATAAASYPVNRSSISKTVSARPPRFIEPSTTLPSSAPSSSRSSSTSAEPSTPSTPGRASATQSRSSRLVRSAMAVISRPARSVPRAGWSAAISTSVPPGPRNDSARGRPATVSATSPGRRARVSMTSASRSANTAGLSAFIRW